QAPTATLSLHDALPIYALAPSQGSRCGSYDDLVEECERLYRRHSLPTIFRVLSLSEPGFDRRLEALGYAGEGDSCVLYGMIGDRSEEHTSELQSRSDLV